MLINMRVCKYHFSHNTTKYFTILKSVLRIRIRNILAYRTRIRKNERIYGSGSKGQNIIIKMREKKYFALKTQT